MRLVLHYWYVLAASILHVMSYIVASIFYGYTQDHWSKELQFQNQSINNICISKKHHAYHIGLDSIHFSRMWIKLINGVFLLVKIDLVIWSNYKKYEFFTYNTAEQQRIKNWNYVDNLIPNLIFCIQLKNIGSFCHLD